MTELQLHKFITNRGVEYHTYGKETFAFIMIGDLLEWNELIKWMLDEGGLDATMKDGYFCYEMNNICEQNDIEISNIFDLTI